jgi:hypothetical protein
VKDFTCFPQRYNLSAPFFGVLREYGATVGTALDGSFQRGEVPATVVRYFMLTVEPSEMRFISQSVYFYPRPAHRRLDFPT